MAATNSLSDTDAQQEVAHDEHSEEKKPVCDKSLVKAATRSLIHIIPVLVTLTLIAMSAMTLYYSDLDAFSTQDVALQAFQFAVKAHEILITISITDIVLHRVRWDLLVLGEMPFGFLTSAYQLSRVEYLFSYQFWGAAWRLRKGPGHLRRLSLGLLIMLACALTLTVGPSSGVLMIPKLNWWPLEWPFGSTSLNLFSSNRENDPRWPNTLAWHDCGGNLTCPGTSCVDILSWASGLTWNNVRAEVPMITGGDNFYRWVVSNATDYPSGWTVTTSPSTYCDNQVRLCR